MYLGLGGGYCCCKDEGRGGSGPRCMRLALGLKHIFVPVHNIFRQAISRENEETLRGICHCSSERLAMDSMKCGRDSI